MKRDNKVSTLSDVDLKDHGWGWVVVVACIFINMIIGGLERSKGLMYIVFIDHFNSSAAVTAYLFSVVTTMRLCGGPLVGMLLAYLSCRVMIAAGSIIWFFGCLLSVFAPNIGYMFFSYGFLGGIGAFLVYVPSIIILSSYFDKRLALATGLSTAGVGMGSMAFPPLIDFLSNHYSFSGLFLVIASIFLNIAPLALLLRPVYLQKRILELDRDRRTIKNLKKRTIHPRRDNVIGCEDMLKAGEGTNPPDLIDADRSDIDADRSDIDADRSDVDPDRSDVDPDRSDIDHVLDENQCKRYEVQNERRSEMTDKMEIGKNHRSSFLKRMLPRHSGKTIRKAESIHTVESYGKTSPGFIGRGVSSRELHQAGSAGFTKSLHTNVGMPSSVVLRNKHGRCNTDTKVSFSCTRQVDEFIIGELELYKSRDKIRMFDYHGMSFPTSHREWMEARRKRRLTREDSVIEETCETESCIQEDDALVAKAKSKLCHCYLLQDPVFSLFCVSLLFATMALHTLMTFFPALVQSHGYTQTDAAGLIAITGAVDSVSRVFIFGFGFDSSAIKPYRMWVYNGVLFGLMGVALATVFLVTYIQFVIVSAVLGVIMAGIICPKALIIIDILSADMLPFSFGILLMFQGVGTLTGSPLSGVLYDVFKDYEIIFYFTAALSLISTALFLVANIIFHKSRFRRARDVT